jgi:hypothetical protein
MHLVQLLLPAAVAGARITDIHFASVRRELTEKFGGVTAYMRAPAIGLWKDEQGGVEGDEMIMVEVVVDDLDRDWWDHYRKLLEQRFRQQSILVRAWPMEPL